MAETHLPRRHTLSDYESKALDAIREWRYPDKSWLARASHSFQAGLNSITNQIRRIPGVDWTIDNVVSDRQVQPKVSIAVTKYEPFWVATVWLEVLPLLHV